MSFRYCLGLAVGFCLSTSAAHAQLITDTAQVNAARDTLFRQATTLRLQAQQRAYGIKNNLHGTGQRRHVIRGYVLGTPPNMSAVDKPSKPVPVAHWRHVTIYGYAGTVEERFKLVQNGTPLLREKRLNGAVTWLQIRPLALDAVRPTSAAKRHTGFYVREGYMSLDGKQYAFPRPLQ